MKKIKQLEHKRNELLGVEFYEDKECSIPFDFGKDVKNLYVELKDGDCTPIFRLSQMLTYPTAIFTPIWYLGFYDGISPHTPVITLNDVLCNDDVGIRVDLSKYIPEDNAVLFLSEEDCKQYKDCFPNNHIGLYINDGNNNETFIANNIESLISGIVKVKKSNATIFLRSGTQTKLKKANEVAEYLWKNCGIKPDLFVMHYFPKLKPRYRNDEVKLFDIKEDMYEAEYFSCFNKIIITNSTGILEPQNTERLQVIDCKEIFEDYLNSNL